MTRAVVLPGDSVMAKMQARIKDARLRAYLNETCYAVLTTDSVEFVFPHRFQLHYEKTRDRYPILCRELGCKITLRLIPAQGE
jgi:hypothetical protein